MCFDIGYQHLGCWGQNTSRILNKEVYATLCYQAGLGWVSAPKVRAGTPFLGQEALVAQKAAGQTRRLVSFSIAYVACNAWHAQNRSLCLAVAAGTRTCLLHCHPTPRPYYTCLLHVPVVRKV